MKKYGLRKGIKSVVYARVSTDDESQLNSFEAQAAYYEQFCRENGFNYLKTYSDRGKSGTNVGRPQFQEMLSDAGINIEKIDGVKHYNFIPSGKKPKFELIIVKDVARFARNVADTVNLVKLLRENSVYVLFESQGICTINSDSNSMLTIFGMLAESESQATSRRQKFAMQYRVKNKIYNGNALPYGYERDLTGDIIINEEKAEKVRYMFERAKEIGSRTIAAEMNEKGWKTESGKDWSSTQVYQTLEKKAYYGNPEINKYSTLQLNSTPKRLKNQQVEIENALPPIISKELYDEVRISIEKRTSVSKFGQKQPKTEDIFYQKIKCGCCGGMFTRKRSLVQGKNGTREYYSYYCLNRNRKSNCTNKRAISDNLLKKMVVSVNPKIISEGKGSLGGTYWLIDKAINEMKKRHDVSIKKLEAECAAIDVELKRLEEIYLEANSTPNTREMISKKIEKESIEKQVILQKISRLTFENLDFYLKEAKELNNSIKQLSQKQLTDAEKISIVKEIYVNDDSTLNVSLKTLEYNEIIKDLNELLDDDLKLNEHGTLEEERNTFMFIQEGKNFTEMSNHIQKELHENEEEMQYQMVKLMNESTSLI